MSKRRIVSLRDPNERTLGRLSRRLDLIIQDSADHFTEALAITVELARAGDSDTVRQRAAALLINLQLEAVAMRAKLDQVPSEESNKPQVQVVLVDNVSLAIASERARKERELGSGGGS